jgi:hypothetical protein
MWACAAAATMYTQEVTLYNFYGEMGLQYITWEQIDCDNSTEVTVNLQYGKLVQKSRILIFFDRNNPNCKYDMDHVCAK